MAITYIYAMSHQILIGLHVYINILAGIYLIIILENIRKIKNVKKKLVPQNVGPTQART